MVILFVFEFVGKLYLQICKGLIEVFLCEIMQLFYVWKIDYVDIKINSEMYVLLNCVMLFLVFDDINYFL